MFQWQMQCSYTFTFYYFSILNLERNTLLYIYIYTLKDFVLHEKSKKLLRNYSNHCLKTVQN